MPKGSFRVRPGEIRIRVGEPIRVEGMRLEDRDRLLALSRAAVAELIEDADGMVGTAGPADGGRTDDGEEGRA
jgi:hypothetical protein